MNWEAVLGIFGVIASIAFAYLAFARGDSGEQAAPTDMTHLLAELRAEVERAGDKATVAFTGEPIVTVRPDAFKRLLHNLVGNASRFADTVARLGFDYVSGKLLGE